MKQRLHYFDILKGIAIFLVVMGHVLTMCVRDIDRAAVFKFIGEIHMPLFFFISGWFTFKAAADGHVRVLSIGRRALQLLLPMAAVSSLWIWYFPHSGLQSPLVSTFAGLWSDPWKNGYWFTPVLFQIMLLYAACCPVLSRLRSASAALAFTAGVWAVLMAVSLSLGAKAAGWTSFGLTAQFFPVFMAGAIASRHRDAFNRVCESGTGVTVAMLAGACLLYFICWPWEFPAAYDGLPGRIAVPVARTLFHICLAIVAIAVIRPWSARIYATVAPCGTGRRFADLWQLLGRKSLSIYLLLYFLLFPLGVCREALLSLGLGFTPLVVFSAAVAACIVALTLGINAIISRSPLLALLLTGTIPQKDEILS